MIDDRMQHDPFVMKRVERLLKRKMNDAKIGVLNVKANWSIIAGDPICLCEHMFQREVVGLLKAGEFYSRYWMDEGADRIAVFRAPMTCHNSALVRNVAHNKDADHWYRYMTTITILNAWDTSCHALCGCDFDSDIFLTSDNSILVDRHTELPAILCEQSNATKIIPTESDIVESNIRVFNSNVGAITNRGASRITLMRKYPEGSKEREILEYRICATQYLQQECIDAVKNAILKPESKKWYIRSEIMKSDMSDEEKELYLSVCSDKRPYFFKYIYPRINKEYSAYVLNTQKKALRLFRKDVTELKNADYSTLTDQEKEFLSDYEKYDPVLEYPCVMNRICWAVEEELDGYVTKHKDDFEFDYTIMKTDEQYTESQYKEVKKVYKQYTTRMEEIAKHAKKERVRQSDVNMQRQILKDEIKMLCLECCSNEEVLCNIILDLCYKKERSKAFAWDICGAQIIRNLLKNNDNMISVPVQDDDGDIEFRGRRYRIERREYIEKEDIMEVLNGTE